MGWIKRNLFFVIGVVLALGLLGADGLYIYQGWSRNSQAAVKLNEIYGTLKDLQGRKPGPGNGLIDNTQAARQQQQQLQSWIKSAKQYFQPIPPIPPADVTSEAYTAALGLTIDQLQHEAGSAGVVLPPKFDFSFSAERNRVTFAAGSLDPLAAQLGEVRAIAETVIAARVNALDNIQRVRVSADDASGSAGDYLDDQPVADDLAVISPYEITFRCFTPDLARVISAFAGSSSTFLIKSVNVQPAGGASAAPGAGAAGMPAGPPPGRYPGEPGWGPMPSAPAPGRGGLQTVLKEQLLRVSLEVGIVKLQPEN